MTNLLFVSYSSKISSNRRQRRLAEVWLMTSSVSSTTSKQYFELTSSVLSTF
ncbi:S1 RNA-binding domain-containing protein [Streptococcus pneumoniae]|nr:S1 RNA-binding domain-containing protein [Streptococcus pneumoniae]